MTPGQQVSPRVSTTSARKGMSKSQARPQRGGLLLSARSGFQRPDCLYSMATRDILDLQPEAAHAR